jgi:putative transposase
MVKLPRSTFYYQECLLLATDKHQHHKEWIKAIYDANGGLYGYRRITLALKTLGETINHKTVKRLMDVLGLRSLVKVKKYVAYKGEVGRTAPNVLKRRFKAKKANMKWVTDVTEFKVAGEKLYLSPVIDLYNCEVVAFATARRPVYEMVDSMLRKAFAKLKKVRKGDKLIMHSDQGWQYQMATYQKTLTDHKVVQSMSRKGNCHDNAAMESFFGILKSEMFHLQSFASVEALEKSIAKYIHYYNNYRIKDKLGGLSPVNYRIQAAAI